MAGRSLSPVVALTGTPGTGKSTVAAALARAGHAVLSLSRFLGDPRFDLGADPDRPGTRVLDEEAIDVHLQEGLEAHMGPGRAPSFIDSHFAHTLHVVDRIIVLRCRPGVLKARLGSRGDTARKVRENMEAEGIDLILQEAVLVRDKRRGSGEHVGVAQVDTTTSSVDETVRAVLDLATAPAENLEIQPVDWSDEVLGWY